MSFFIIKSPQECSGMVELTEIGHWGETDLYLFLYDGISLAYIWLTCFIFLIVFLASWGNTKKSSLLIFLLNIIQLLLIISFLSTDLLVFYISFESILIPMFILIGIWGSRSEKIKAGYYLFFYTLVGSTFFLLGIIIIYYYTGTTNSLIISLQDCSLQKVLWFMFFIAFAVKIPSFPFHIWLPEAHVEAPTVGSIILAAILLKLGSYGYIRFMLPIFDKDITEYYFPVIVCTAGCSIIFASLTAIRQIDIKRIIAYSSIAHMNMAVIGIFSNIEESLQGSFVLTISHGFVSAGLFLLLGCLYDRYHSRLVYSYSGMVAVMPIFSIFFIVFSLANIGFPISYNFIGEICIAIGIIKLKNIVFIILILMGILFSVAYTMWLVNRIIFGDIKTTKIIQFYDLEPKETVCFITLLFPTILLGICPQIFEIIWYNDLKVLIY
jgi:NADH-ubiquinone oxidoreductase chain 4